MVPERKGNQIANAVWYWNKGNKKQPKEIRFGILTKLFYPIVLFKIRMFIFRDENLKDMLG